MLGCLCFFSHFVNIHGTVSAAAPTPIVFKNSRRFFIIISSVVLIALKYPVEQIVNLFATMPDFDREKTRYQVEFAKRKEYTPYNCDSLKSYDLCFAKQYKDKLCLEGYFSKKYEENRNVKHPLGYFRVQSWRDFRQEESEKQNNKPNDLNRKGGNLKSD